MPYMPYFGVLSQNTIPQTATPNIVAIYKATPPSYTTRLVNNDASSAVMLGDEGVNPPTTSRGTATSGRYVAGPSVPAYLGVTVYCTAEASGKTKSNVASAYIE
jgi:hypothetical protein